MILQLIVPKFRWQSLKSDFKLKRFGDFAINCSEITKAKFEFRLQIGKVLCHFNDFLDISDLQEKLFFRLKLVGTPCMFKHGL